MEYCRGIANPIGIKVRAWAATVVWAVVVFAASANAKCGVFLFACSLRTLLRAHASALSVSTSTSTPFPRSQVGPSTDPVELIALLRVLWPNPRKQRGKIVLITRLGAKAVRAKLPAFISAVAGAGFDAPVVWVCDPMHGNTRVTASGIKTRSFDDVLEGAWRAEG